MSYSIYTLNDMYFILKLHNKFIILLWLTVLSYGMNTEYVNIILYWLIIEPFLHSFVICNVVKLYQNIFLKLNLV